MTKIRWGIVGAARVNERLMPAIIASDLGDLIAIGSRRKGAAKECLLKHAPNLEDKVQAFDGLDRPIGVPIDQNVEAIFHLILPYLKVFSDLHRVRPSQVVSLILWETLGFFQGRCSCPIFVPGLKPYWRGFDYQTLVMVLEPLEEEDDKKLLKDDK